MSRKNFLKILVHHAVLDGFGDMAGIYVILSFQIGDRSRHFEYPCVRPRAEVQSIHSHLQKISAL